MTNFEKYKNEIAAIVESGDRVAINRNTKRPVPCNSLGDCPDCLLSDPTRIYDECYVEFVKWLLEEYVEPRFSEADVMLAKALKAFGVAKVARNNMESYWVDESRTCIRLPKGSFLAIKAGTAIDIDDILKEGGYSD